MDFFKKTKEAYRKYAKFIDALISVFLIPQVLFFAVTASTKDQYEGEFERIPLYICMGVVLLSMYSIFRAAILFDETLRKRFLENTASPERKALLLYPLRQRSFWLRALLIAVIYFALPLSWTCNMMVAALGVNSFLMKLLALLAIYAALLLLAVLAYLSAMRVWARREENVDYTEGAYTKTIAFLVGVYMGGTIFLVMIGVPLLAPLFRLLFSGAGVQFLLAFVCLIFLLWGFRIMRSLRKRRAFLKELRSACKEKGVSLSAVRKPYLSAVFKVKGESFSFSVGGKSYSCKLIASRSRLLPAAIYPGGILSYTHRIRFLKFTLFQYHTRQKFAYRSDARKIIILNPIPKHTYTYHEGRRTEIDNGDRIGEYKVYSASGFFSALRLDVLDR